MQVYLQLRGIGSNILQSHTNLLSHAIGSSLSISSNLIIISVINEIITNMVEIRFTIQLKTNDKMRIQSVLSDINYVQKLQNYLRNDSNTVFGVNTAQNIVVIGVECLHDECPSFVVCFFINFFFLLLFFAFFYA